MLSRSGRQHWIPLDTPIISLSLGEVREFHIGRPDPKDVKKTITTNRFVLRPGDLFILGPRTNAAYRHSIVPVHQERLIQREPEVEVAPLSCATLPPLSPERRPESELRGRKRVARFERRLAKSRPQREEDGFKRNKSERGSF